MFLLLVALFFFHLFPPWRIHTGANRAIKASKVFPLLSHFFFFQSSWCRSKRDTMGLRLTQNAPSARFHPLSVYLKESRDGRSKAGETLEVETNSRGKVSSTILSWENFTPFLLFFFPERPFLSQHFVFLPLGMTKVRVGEVSHGRSLVLVW